MTSGNVWQSACESNTCLEVQVNGDTVILRESSTPDREVVTPLASWQQWQGNARAEERATIVAGLRAKTGDRRSSHPGRSCEVCDTTDWLADLIERGEFADVAAGDE